MRVVAIDIETHEEKDISKYGPGSHRHYLDGEDSYIMGVALSDEDGDEYLPPTRETFSRLKAMQDDVLFVGHNILYDLSWLTYEDFRPQHVADTMGLVRLLDEDRMSYSLNACVADYLGAQKNEDEIKAWCAEQGLKGAPQLHMDKMPQEMVARYAVVDTRLTYDLYYKLLPQIEAQELDRIWTIECELLPILADMHHRGIRIDNERREQASADLEAETAELMAWMEKKAGCEFNPNSGKQLAEVFDTLGIPYRATEKGNPSFKAENLLPFGVDPDLGYFPHVLVTHNKLQKLKRDFVDRMEDFMVQGRVHPVINPYGTRTGRPTSKTPNIFQIPKRGRGKEICRVLFLPEEHHQWASMDYASEEYRVFAHYAVGKGSDRYRDRYNAEGEEKYDMHIENGKLAGVDRNKAKTIGLGVLFGMGSEKMAASLGEGREKGLEIVKRFHDVNPAFRATSQLVEARVKSRGYIHTILGRRRRLTRETAYRGLNFLTQANSADLAKLAIVEAKRQGVLDHVNLLLWLYDEFNISFAPEDYSYVDEFKRIGETAILFRVKMALDLGYGPNWGEVK